MYDEFTNNIISEPGKIFSKKEIKVKVIFLIFKKQ